MKNRILEYCLYFQLGEFVTAKTWNKTFILLTALL